jgi:hypothetical protein
MPCARAVPVEHPRLPLTQWTYSPPARQYVSTAGTRWWSRPASTPCRPRAAAPCTARPSRLRSSTRSSISAAPFRSAAPGALPPGPVRACVRACVRARRRRLPQAGRCTQLPAPSPQPRGPVPPVARPRARASGVRPLATVPDQRQNRRLQTKWLCCCCAVPDTRSPRCTETAAATSRADGGPRYN